MVGVIALQTHLNQTRVANARQRKENLTEIESCEVFNLHLAYKLLFKPLILQNSIHTWVASSESFVGFFILQCISS